MAAKCRHFYLLPVSQQYICGMQKPSLPSGTRDFGPKAFEQRRYVMGVMEKVFRLHGFQGIETPALENLSTLQGKYGDEGDQLLFKVLNSGDFLSKVKEEDKANIQSKELLPKISNRGLRYDLTVPLARFVVMNSNEIQFPFKRYQMQPVWRADRPQKGRYREFWQCDVDVVGTKSVVSEAELIDIYLEVFKELDLGVIVKINHRGILDSFLSIAGNQENWNSFMQAIDKFDKIGLEGVNTELQNRGLSHMLKVWEAYSKLSEQQDITQLIEGLRNIPELQGEELELGILALTEVMELVSDKSLVKWDLRLARGLSYYTGCVFEVLPNDQRLDERFNIGSIGGGGRYDNLTGIFGMKDVAGVGVSFGLDRIMDTLAAMGQGEAVMNESGILFCCMDKESLPMAVTLSRELRSIGFSAEVYPGAVKLKKQLDFANQRKKQWAVIIGESERESGELSVKNLVSGEQSKVIQSELKNHF